MKKRHRRALPGNAPFRGNATVLTVATYNCVIDGANPGACESRRHLPPSLSLTKPGVFEPQFNQNGSSHCSGKCLNTCNTSGRLCHCSVRHCLSRFAVFVNRPRRDRTARSLHSCRSHALLTTFPSGSRSNGWLMSVAASGHVDFSPLFSSFAADR